MKLPFIEMGRLWKDFQLLGEKSEGLVLDMSYLRYVLHQIRCQVRDGKMSRVQRVWAEILGVNGKTSKTVIIG